MDVSSTCGTGRNSRSTVGSLGILAQYLVLITTIPTWSHRGVTPKSRYGSQNRKKRAVQSLRRRLRSWCCWRKSRGIWVRTSSSVDWTTTRCCWWIPGGMSFLLMPSWRSGSSRYRSGTLRASKASNYGRTICCTSPAMRRRRRSSSTSLPSENMTSTNRPRALI